MSEPQKSAPAPAARAPRSGGSALLVALLVLLNLGGTGFIGFKVLRLAHGAGKPAEAEAKAPAGPAKPPPGYVLDPFVVNLNEKGPSRYLKCTMELEVTDEATVEELTRVKRSVRDDVLRFLSSLTVADTLGEEAKGKIEETVVKRIDKQIGGKNRVQRVFFTEFMVQ